MELIIPAGTKRIAAEAYAGSEAERLILPEGLESIGREAFSGCAALTELTLPASLRELGAGAFMGCESLAALRISEGLEAVGEGAFLGCSSLKAAAFPRSLRSIGAMAFWGSGLESVTVPENVSSIGDSAFWECQALKEANILNADADVGDNAFGSCYSLTRGFIAPGYCGKSDAPAMLLYTLLWCSCPGRHGEAVSAQARDYIRANEQLLMERILKYNNTAAMTGLAAQGLLERGNINGYVTQAAALGLTEITALLLRAGGGGENTDTEFEL